MLKKHLIKGALLLTVVAAMPAIAFSEPTSPYMHRQKQMQNSGRMSPQAQQFAMELSDLHREVFMKQFTPEQRAEAMALVGAEKGRSFRGKKMTPDKAVEEVMKRSRGMPMQTGKGSSKMRSSGYNNSMKGNSSSSGYNKSMKKNGSSKDSHPHPRNSPRYSGSTQDYQEAAHPRRQQEVYTNEQDDQGYSSPKHPRGNTNSQYNQNYPKNNQNSYEDRYSEQYTPPKKQEPEKKKWWQRKSDSEKSSKDKENKYHW